MKTKTITAMAVGLTLLLGAAAESQAWCLFGCGRITVNPTVNTHVDTAGRDKRNNSDDVGAKATGHGSVAVNDVIVNAQNNEGAIISPGVNLNSNASANVGFNGGDISVSSGPTIIGSMSDTSVKSNVGNR